ncbi:FAD-binding protein [Bacteriovoracales bacterium]|nr:FAD-binding protein [Bacteriovoracales bacterium]
MDDKKDLIIVGFGAAGAVAALEAADQGARVLLIDRFKGGGSTAISGGVIYAGGGTYYQKLARVQDSPEHMYEYLKSEVGESVSSQTLKKFCEESSGSIDWLREKGVPFSPKFYPKKTSYPPRSYYLYFSGNELSYPHSEPFPRGHRVKGPGLSGETFFDSLKMAVEKNDLIQTKTQSKVLDLIVEESKVKGVKVQTINNEKASTLHNVLSKTLTLLRYVLIYLPFFRVLIEKIILFLESSYSETENIYAEKGVILTSGGYIFNREMVKEFIPQYQKGFPLGTIADDGSGIKMGQRAGGKLSKMERASAWMFFVPPRSFSQGVLVNLKGERICNEEYYGATIGDEIVLKHEGKSYLIFNSSVWKKALRQTLQEPHTWFQVATSFTNLFFNRKRAPTLEKLAEKCGIEETLSKTIESYSQSEKDPLGKSKENKVSLNEGPFYAVRCFLDNKLFPCPTLTLGGLEVDEETGAVLKEDGSIIEGLYAAGRSAAGLTSQTYVSGLSLADCVFSGRRAGKMALSQKDKQAEAA